MKPLFILLLINSLSSQAFNQTNIGSENSICNKPIRPSLYKLKEIKTKSNWFKVYNVGNNVLAIIEPYNYEEAISYLVIGNKRALLFDTGIGVDSISLLVKQLTALPIVVVNSHSHYDHIGGNHEFENVLSLKTDFTEKHSKFGWDHESVKHEVTQEAICLQYIPGLDTAKYAIHPYKTSKFIKNGEVIDLGERKLAIISVPGHTPDAIALYDKKNGYLWTGDSYYDGPIYLFAKETDLLSYQKSIDKLASITPQINKIFSSHNNPVSNPQRLLELKANFNKMKNGKVIGKDDDDNTVLFQFKHFGFKIDKEKLKNVPNTEKGTKI